MEISLNEIRIFARHGVLPDERTIGAWFRVSVNIEAECPKAIESDDLEDTVNYAEVAQVVKQEMNIPSKLLEHVAGRIAKRLMKEMPRIKAVGIKVSKENPPICTECQSASVSLCLKR
ncbi:MAG: dihydroneopterin aldolase [Bacteroidaceae bacterium]|nr:dihydroneopterin aldolase [Bacteroidaceae bacterium]